MSIDVSAATRTRPDREQVARLANFFYDLLIGGTAVPVTIDEGIPDRNDDYFVESTTWTIRRGSDLALLPGYLTLNPVMDPEFELDGLWDLSLEPLKSEGPEEVLLALVVLLAVAILGDGFIFDDIQELFPERIVWPSRIVQSPIFQGNRSAGEALSLLGVRDETITAIYHGIPRWGERLSDAAYQDVVAGIGRGYGLIEDLAADSPEAVVEAIQRTIERWRGVLPPNLVTDLGLVFGEQIRREYGWHWIELQWHTHTWAVDGERGTHLALTSNQWDLAIRPVRTVHAEIGRPAVTALNLVGRFRRIREIEASRQERQDDLFVLFDEH